VNVASDVNEVTVSATKADRDATMAIGSVTVAPGTATGQGIFPLNGAGGQPTPISVTVTAQNGVDAQTYTITVNRALAEPPPPTVAPDLFTEDDSCAPGVPDPAVCAPGTSKDDNVTNVATPRFSVFQSGPGPSLFVDGSTVASEFDPIANTLQPTTPLPDGSHSITYTVTNSAGLVSAQSDPLEVTIDTTAPGN
ncbi:MAG: cadherin-like beta sandwich domain-containing protein, partial [Nitrospira sp.]